jgi:anthranilate synthase component 2
MPRVLLIDNYDSFTFNLVHLIGGLGAEVAVHRNDALSVEEIVAAAPDAIVLSPGPCTPTEAGVCLDLIAAAGPRIPMFGVCLGHQAIGQALGGAVVRAPAPVHGKCARIAHEGATIFRGLDRPFIAVRYHSLVVARDSVPDCLAVTAETDGLVMGLSHRAWPLHGVQFHPESIASEAGARLVRNFLDLAAAWNGSSRH